MIHRMTIACLFCCTLLVFTESVQAESWAFRRSYFSHAVPPEIDARYPKPVSRSAYRQPVKRSYPGIYVRGGFRQNNVILRSGNSFDRTFITEGWVDVLP